MMKTRLRFLVLLALAASLFFACAGSGAEADIIPEDEVPVVAAATEPSDADVSSDTGLLPAVSEETVSAVTAASVEEAPAAPQPELPSDEADADDASDESELFPETSGILEGLTADYLENEFVPVEEEKEYVIDVSSYYDGFSFSEDDFVAVELPEPVPEPAPVVQEKEIALVEISPLPVMQVELEEQEPVAETEPAPVMEPVPVPSPREDLKKPVVIVTEEQASAAAEQEKEVALAELESILSEIPEPEEPSKPVASRSVTLHKNDILEVPYQGNWWVYLGDANSSGALVFSGRDYVAEKTLFTLRAVHEGEALLHFFKQDIIGGVMVDDYLEVIVEEAAQLSEKIELEMFVISQIKPLPPETEESVDPLEVEESTAADTAVNYVQYEERKADVPASRAVTIEDEADIVSGVEETEPVVESKQKTLSDEELFRQAQALESTDIEGALELYMQLVADYPLSQYWNQANRRITYINRFYFFKR